MVGINDVFTETRASSRVHCGVTRNVDRTANPCPLLLLAGSLEPSWIWKGAASTLLRPCDGFSCCFGKSRKTPGFQDQRVSSSAPVKRQPNQRQMSIRGMVWHGPHTHGQICPDTGISLVGDCRSRPERGLKNSRLQSQNGKEIHERCRFNQLQGD